MTRRSHHSASSMPPATAGPSTAAMTGFDNSSRVGPRGPRGGALSVGREIKRGERPVAFKARGIFEVPSRAEGAAFAPQHSDIRRRIRIEGLKCGDQRIGAGGIHRVAGFGTAMDHGPNGTRLLNADGHVTLLGTGYRRDPIMHSRFRRHGLALSWRMSDVWREAGYSLSVTVLLPFLVLFPAWALASFEALASAGALFANGLSLRRAWIAGAVSTSIRAAA